MFFMAIVQRPLRADAARNRARLLAAAKEVFAARGLDATMDEVARRAGVGVGTAYRRFRNRDDLIAALFEERLDEFMGLLDESLADSDPWRGLSSFLERSMEMQAADRGFKELLLQSVEGRERMLRFRAHIRPLVAELVRRARDAGALRADVVEDDVLLVSLMTGAVAEFTSDVEPELWRRALALLLDGLRATARPRCRSGRSARSRQTAQWPAGDQGDADHVPLYPPRPGRDPAGPGDHRRLRGVPRPGHAVGAPAHVPDLRPHRLLRQLARAPRDRCTTARPAIRSSAPRSPTRTGASATRTI